MADNRNTTAKRVEIADAALRLIGRRGIADLTIANLASELGVSPGAPFRHFKTREDILEEVTFRVVEMMEAAFPDPALPPLDRLSRLFLARADILEQNAGLARLIFSDQFAKALPEPAAKNLHGIIKRTRATLLAILQEAAENGQIRRDITPECLIVPVMGTLQHLAFLTALPEKGAGFKRPSPKQVLHTVLALLSPAVNGHGENA